MSHEIVNLGMTLSILFFMLGYFYRKSNRNKHRIFMGLGVAANLITAVFLVVSVHVFYGGDMRAAGFEPITSGILVTAHRLAAIVAAILMLLMVWSGMTHKREIHIMIHRIFLPLYIVVYFSGMYIFA